MSEDAEHATSSGAAASSTRAEATLPIRSRRYDRITIDARDNARVLLGDSGRIFEDDSPEERRAAVLDALYYDGMTAREHQLDSDKYVSIDSFEWVWSSPIKTWLQNPKTPFWISGKPGSGKSTLMNYLCKSESTLDLLRADGQKWKVIRFFFDYRAGHGIANQSEGMLKSFLHQLLQAIPELAERNTMVGESLPSDAFDLNGLEYVFRTSIQRTTTRICAFVDGLDEYEGDLVRLVDLVTTLMDQTGMKLCLASRPDNTLPELLGKYPTIKMQHHNKPSIRACINKAVMIESQQNIDIRLVFTTYLQDQILEKAEGVILWARLATEILLKACRRDVFGESLTDLLEGLPKEIEELYLRIVTRIKAHHQAEAAVVLFLIREFDGSILFDRLFGAWDFLVHTTPDMGLRTDLTSENFRARIQATLGSLLEINDPVFVGDMRVRQTHKTLSVFLERSTWIETTLPRGLCICYPDAFILRLEVNIIKTAANDYVFNGKIPRFFSPLGSDLDDEILGKETTWRPGSYRMTWSRRISFLTEAIVDLPVQASNYGTVSEDLNRDICCCLRSELMESMRYAFKFHIPYYLQYLLDTSLPIDLMLMSRHFLVSVVKHLLQTDRARLETWKQICLDIAVAADISDSSYFEQALGRQSLDEVADRRLSHRNSVINELVTLGVQFGSPQLCLILNDERLRWNASTDLFLRGITRSRASCLWPTEHHDTCRLPYKDTGMLYHWATGDNLERYVFDQKLCLKFLLDSGENINSACFPGGTVLHAILDKLLGLGLKGKYYEAAQDWDSIYTACGKRFVVAIRAGADPKVSGSDGDVLKTAQKHQKRDERVARKNKWMRRFDESMSIRVEVRSKIIAMLEHYWQNNELPLDAEALVGIREEPEAS